VVRSVATALHVHAPTVGALREGIKRAVLGRRGAAQRAEYARPQDEEHGPERYAADVSQEARDESGKWTAGSSHAGDSPLDKRKQPGKGRGNPARAKPMKYNTENRRPESIAPPHEVRDEAKKDRLAEAMGEHGWQGRPLLVVDTGTDTAWTGSHRLEAAKQAGLDHIPVVRISPDYEKWGADLEGASDDYDRLSVLERIQAEDGGMDEALSLMRAELENDRKEKGS
jgi:hypothetical protein